MRTRLKHAIELTLCRSGATRYARLRRLKGAVILAYHNIVPAGEPVQGDRSLHLPESEFVRQLDLLYQTHDVVPLESLLEPDGSRRDRPRAVITFDDACVGAVSVGIAEVAKRGFPATIFVAPGLLGGHSFWWDTLAHPKEGLTAELRYEALELLAGKNEEISRWADRRELAWHAVPDHQKAATMEQLRVVERNPGISLASHTWSHPNLPQLGEGELEDELSRPLRWLLDNFNQVIPWLAYPYGRASKRVAAAAAAAGYVGGLMVTGGWIADPIGRAEDPYLLPRQNIAAGLSLAGFELRVSGIRTG